MATNTASIPLSVVKNVSESLQDDAVRQVKADAVLISGENKYTPQVIINDESQAKNLFISLSNSVKDTWKRLVGRDSENSNEYFVIPYSTNTSEGTKSNSKTDGFHVMLLVRGAMAEAFGESSYPIEVGSILKSLNAQPECVITLRTDIEKFYGPQDSGWSDDYYYAATHAMQLLSTEDDNN